jgi:hypothetical protein
MPRNPELQECSKCSELNILGTYCPEELCMLFGDDGAGNSTCYYNSQLKDKYSNLRIDNSSCLNKKDVACETYDSRTECIGLSNKNVVVDVLYDAQQNRYGTTNEITQNSADEVGRGKCLWVVDYTDPADSECVRDADLSNLYNKPGYDCAFTTGSESCLLDFENPNTTMYIFGETFEENGIYSKSELIKMSSMTSEKADTYVSATPIINYPTLIYPVTKMKNFKTEIVPTLTEGKYILRYYSEDESKNLEVVKKLNFTLLKDLSGVIVNYTLASAFYTGSDMYLTNLTIYVNYNETLICHVNLTNVFDPSISFLGDAVKITPDLVWYYTYLADGSYDATISCSDEHLQDFYNVTHIDVDADVSIHDATPRGETFRAGEIEIGIETNTTATCYYTEDPSAVIASNAAPNPDLSVWTKYDQTGQYKHNASITETATAMRYFYSACYFTYANEPSEWYMWNNGDVVYYAIDEVPPTSSLIDATTGDKYNSSIAVESLELQILCDDYSSILEVERNYSFGCKDEISVTKYYVNYSNVNQVLQTFNPETIDNGEVMTFDLPPYYAKVYINVTTKDLGNNEDVSKFFINVRNLSFIEPIAVICDPETGICT